MLEILNSINNNTRGKSRAQVALEYIVVAGIVLVFVGIIFFYSTSTVTNSINDSKAITAVNKIASAINQVYALGPGSRISVDVEMPPDVISYSLQNNLVRLVILSGDRNVTYYADTKANVSGALPITEGVQTLTLEVDSSGAVSLASETLGISLTPAMILVAVDYNTGYNTSHPINLWNQSGGKAGSFTSSITGNVSPLVSLGALPSALDANASQNVNLTISFPANQTAGVYSGILRIDSNIGSATTFIQVSINSAQCVTQGACVGGTPDGNVYSLGLLSILNKWQIDLNTIGFLKSDLNKLCDANTCYLISDLNRLGPAGAPADANYIIRTPDARLPNAFALSTLPTGLLKHDGNGVLQTVTPGLDYIPGSLSYATVLQEPFVGSNNVTGRLGALGWSLTVNGAGAAASCGLADVNRIGLLTMTTGTTAKGRSCVDLGITTVRLSGDEVIEFSMQLPILADATNNYIVRMGLGDSPSADFVDGVYFEYDRTQSLNWRIAASNNSTRTKVNTSAAVSTSWARFKIDFNATGNGATFYINDTNVGVIGSNVPIAAGRETGPTFYIIKSAGTTARTAVVDYWTLIKPIPGGR